MSQNKPLLEDLIREFATLTQDEKKTEVLRILLDYMNLLFEDTQEEILLEDFTAYEGDDFIYFFLPDNYEGKELVNLQKVAIQTIKEFINYCKKKKLLNKEALQEWKEVLK
jgi:hypothetical protein